MSKDRIVLAHGSGGKLSHELVQKMFLPVFDNPVLNQLNDGALVDIGGTQLVFSTDSFVVNPVVFAGGDIGKLAVCGTVNDIAMGGAKPLFLSAGFIMEEGLPMELLERIIKSMEEAAKEAGVRIVTGDTKVVEKGSVDQIFINTSGIGLAIPGIRVGGSQARPGDKVIINGTMGDHGLALMANRQGLEFQNKIASDCAPLNHLVAKTLEICPETRVLRDPTRGGVATTLNEIAQQSGVGILLEEEALPVREQVRGVCEILGLDPLYVANEGKVLAIVPGDRADEVLAAMRQEKYGAEAAVIGEVVEEPKGKVFLQTLIGGRRIVDMLVGDQLPRIC
ncbi:MAG: hydrogenase expression/formation protein HypE [Clostridia bacterium]|nr:hydrogenase expression/formation protein HypE [Clostridia bacterium]